jgi:hypothetical protein
MLLIYSSEQTRRRQCNSKERWLFVIKACMISDKRILNSKRLADEKELDGGKRLSSHAIIPRAI